MRYGIFTYGSRGDVQPYISLALALMENGHEVILGAPENFADFIGGYGVKFHPLYGDFNAMLYASEGLKILKDRNSFAFVDYLLKAVHRVGADLERDFFEGCKNVDSIIVSNSLLFRGGVVAEKLNLKWAVLQLNLPIMQPNRDFSVLGFNRVPWINLTVTKIIRKLFWRMAKKEVNDFRRTLGLPQMEKSMFQVVDEHKILNIFSFSQELFARPENWREGEIVTGFLTLPKLKRENHPHDLVPEGLPEWLKAGERPVYIGFGSIPVPDTEKFYSMITQILETTDTRILFCTEYSSISGLHDHPNLFVFRYTNHEWLLPQCKIAVVHGGMGTVAAVLKAGIPLIIISIIGDQHMCGKIVMRKKIGVHIPWKKLTAGKLQQAFNLVTEPQMIKNSLEIGEKINKEDGVKAAVEALENYFVTRPFSIPELTLEASN